MIDETATIPDTSTSGEPGQQAEAAGVAAPKKKRGKAGAKAAAAAIEGRIGYKFSDPALLTTAFTHVSALKPATKSTGTTALTITSNSWVARKSVSNHLPLHIQSSSKGLLSF